MQALQWNRISRTPLRVILGGADPAARCADAISGGGGGRGVAGSESRGDGMSSGRGSGAAVRGLLTPPGGKPLLDMTDAEDLYRLHVRSGQATLATLVQVGLLAAEESLSAWCELQ